MFRLKFLVVAVTLLTILSSNLVHAKWSLTPRLYSQGIYDDNIFLTETNEQDDFIYTISPGINLSYLTPTGEIALDYEFRRNLYSDFSQLDYSAHQARANARKDIGSWFAAGISELFLRDEDPLELIGITQFEKPSIRSGRRDRYTRNIVEPWGEVRFGENRSIRFGYRNHILRNDRDDIADQDENAGNGLLTYRFNVNNGIEIFYEYIDKEYDDTIPPTADKDFDGHTARGKYTYYYDPKTSFFFQYMYYYRDFETDSTEFFDYQVHVPSIGFARDLYKNVTLSGGAGYAYRDAESPGDDEEAFYGLGTLTAQYKRLFLDLYGETGVGEDYVTAESEGFNKFSRAGVNARYQLLERLWIGGFFYIEEEDFTDRDREDTSWSIRGTVDYQILKWLFLAFEYEHYERDSDADFEDYAVNRYFGRVTVQYDIAEFL